MKGGLWVVCLLWTLFVIFAYINGGGHGESAIQQAARAADACAFLIAGYVVARTVDFIVRLLERGTAGLP
jgi:hypothetical protein